MKRKFMTTHVYIDDSIHDAQNFITIALVVSKEPLDSYVADALIESGYDPRNDEFKSHRPMKGDEKAQQARKSIGNLLFLHSCKIYLIFISRSEREVAFNYILQALHDIMSKPEEGGQKIIAYPDRGLIPAKIKSGFRRPNLEFYPLDDSKKVMGIQVADLVSHFVSSILKRILNPKSENPNNFKDNVTLDFELWAELRYSLASSTLFNSLAHEYSDDPVEWASHLPYGLLISTQCPQDIRDAIEFRFSKVYFGCIH